MMFGTAGQACTTGVGDGVADGRGVGEGVADGRGVAVGTGVGEAVGVGVGVGVVPGGGVAVAVGNGVGVGVCSHVKQLRLLSLDELGASICPVGPQAESIRRDVATKVTLTILFELKIEFMAIPPNRFVKPLKSNPRTTSGPLSVEGM